MPQKTLISHTKADETMDQAIPKKACLIGLGLITTRYLTGWTETDFIKLCAVADQKETAIGRSHYSQYPFYQSYQDMIIREKPDYAIISTPPESHFEIARFCLLHDVNIIIEKPVTLCMEDFDVLQTLTAQKNLVFWTLFHWLGGIETRAFTKQYDLSHIQAIQIQVQDPYCDENNIIKKDRRHLMGAWIDSGVNALSLLKRLLPFQNVEIQKTEAEACKETKLPIYVKANLLIDGVQVEITVDWRNNTDCKESFVTLDNRQIHINHSAQSITDGATTEYGNIPRLDEHYKTLFAQLEEKSNADFSRAVHQILFEVNQLL